MIRRKEVELGGSTLSIEMGRIAKQADGAALVRVAPVSMERIRASAAVVRVWPASVCAQRMAARRRRMVEGASPARPVASSSDADQAT